MRDRHETRQRTVDSQGRTLREAMAAASADAAARRDAKRAAKTEPAVTDGPTLSEAIADAWGTGLSSDDDARAWVKANKRHRIGDLAGVHLFPDRIVRLNVWPLPGGESYPIDGVEATVDNSGGIAARATLTRALAPGLHGWQKKIDTREAWLQVDGPGFQWIVPIETRQARGARQFAAAITRTARQAAGS